MIHYLDNEMKNNSFNSDNENSSKSSEDNDNNNLFKFGSINNYMPKKISFCDILNLCKNPELKCIDVDYKNSKAIKFLKFLCSKFNLSYTTGKKQIKIIDADNKNNTYDNNNYWNFKNYCNRYNCDIYNLKDLDDKKKYFLLRRCKELGIKYTEIEYSVISKKENCENDGINILEEIKLKIDEDDRNGLFEEMKDDYYNNNIPNCNRREFINQYIEGIKWLLNTYYDKVLSWTWFFKYRFWKNKCKSYGPLISDLCDFKENENFEFDQGEPLKPLTQLLTILPSESFNLLPNSYKELLNINEIKELYPKISSFSSKSSMFKMCSSLPLFDSNKYKDLLKKLNKNLTEEELLRNSFGEMKEFHSHKTKEQMKILDDCIFLMENNNYDNALKKINELIRMIK
ncbi:hypothetical protein BCR32DRAFT_243018 [Anaeromyces robustus]|uniref:Xrn1 helical domain-containing protein n=1 Tax=Anaeromyces robustus TaxID=1754192 RepID=A0A1Y1XDT6_9FUNG|nr:hypothetical protein BCR32DRAFT_243018 [Anaeromyces robustus]|eukprot:ORX83885.1 hypothetical protein BCR32DRAFT_243018 [Anaeromyces robustus]